METRATANRVDILLFLPFLTLTEKTYFADLLLHFYRWSGGHIKWGQSFRVRHITTGRYLFLDEEKGLLLVDPEKANSKMSAFCFRISKVFVQPAVRFILTCLD